MLTVKLSPPTITRPIATRLSAPAPVALASGSAPKTVAMVVIMIGRSRVTAPLITASRGSRPSSPSWLVHHQDPVLGHQPDKQNQTDLAVDIDRLPAKPQRQDGTGEAERHGQHHHERGAEGFVAHIGERDSVRETLGLGQSHAEA